MVGLTELGRAISETWPQGSDDYITHQKLLGVAEYVPTIAEQIRANIIDRLNAEGRAWVTLPQACVVLGVTRQTLTRNREAWATKHGQGWHKGTSKNSPVLFSMEWLRIVKAKELSEGEPEDAFEANKGEWRHLRGLNALNKMVQVLMSSGGKVEDIVVTGLSAEASKALRAAGMFVKRMPLLAALTQHPWANSKRLAEFEAWFEHQVSLIRQRIDQMKAQGEQQRIEGLRMKALGPKTPRKSKSTL
ncbi:MAG: hypothetical protein B7X39_14100 [Lysobacterales bacterium 14-68-21]|jgi:hypothetical protein|nr:MAG: hypothetical protein B7X45_12990 [Xanthomonadales bacterium 15-68-25]OZB65378.1 MAG: hypothetical protein B7X39_14100 [Xanthomonadales bacterium 14-68-21]